jgi:hypothetical protein
MPQRKKTPQKKKKVSTKRFKSIKGHRNSYSIEKKQEVVNYAVKNGRNEAARHFELDNSMVGRWMKASEKWFEKNKNTKKIGSGRKEFFPEAEKKLYDWIIEQRKKGLGVSYTSVRIKMSEILREPEMINLHDNSVDFKLSSSWMSGFMKRYRLSRRRRTKISQKLPAQTNELLNNFQQHIIRLRTEKSYEMANILNMDETPVWFDMAGNFTIDQTGEKTIQICGTGNEKNRFTVVLTCAAGRYIFRGGY